MQRPNSLKFANIAAVLACLLAFTLFLAGSRHAGAQVAESTVSLSTHTPLKVTTGEATRVSHYNPEQKLRLALGVQPPHMAEEEQFIKELVTKGSPNFHKFLSPAEWNARFGPSVADEQAVVDWATSQGLTVTKRYPNRLIVDVEGPAGVIEKAFGVTINNYQVGEEVDFSNDRDPQIPASLNGILHSVLGLNNIERVHRLGTGKAAPKGPDYVEGPAISQAFSGHGDGDPTKSPANRAAANQAAGAAANPTPADSYPLSGGVANPDNIQSSEGYDYNALQRLSHCCNEWGDSAGSPTESSIALVGYGNYNYSDATTFFNYYGMAWYLYAYYINGTGFPAVDGEAPLDVEYAGAMSNSYGSYLDTARIYEYEMPNNQYATYADAYEDIDSDNYASVVSTSYVFTENVGFSGSIATGTMHPIFNTMVGEGRTLIAASGDNGASAGCGDATALEYPATDPDFLAAGGTQLLLDSNGIYTSETAWQGESWTGACGSNHGGSTGGVSVLFAAPYWQTITNSTYPDGVVSPFYLWKDGGEYVETGNGNRMVPDISLTANPDVMGEWYYSGGSWQDEGGTSIVAPELAGFFAQENSYLDYVGNICGSGTSACSPVGLATPFMYEDAIDGAPHNPFYDMTSGCNDNDITALDHLFYFCAYTGYDPITGWGSANMLQLAWGINWELIPAYGQPSIAFSGPATGSSTWYNTNQQVNWTVTDAGSGGYPAPGVAGFTQGWDSIPSDPGSEAHSGEGNSFYSGPQYSFATSGCLAFTANGCAGNAGAQGCHTVHVEAWDNQGRNATSTYGPLCYDSVAPTISAGTNPTTSGTVWVDKSVVVTLTPTDPGGSNASGIYKTYYAINSGSCYPGSLGPCSVYSGPFTISGQQQSYIYYFTEDNAGNFSNETYIWVSIDETAPTTASSLSGTVVSGSVYRSAVQVTLNASDTGGSGVKNTYYELDGGGQTTYSTAFTVSALGNHTVKYWSVDAAGNVESAKTVSFSVDSLGVLTTPTPGSTLGSSATFSWAAGVGATKYEFRLGTAGPGSKDVYNAADMTTTGLTTGSIPVPAYGVTLYARLYSFIDGVAEYNDYTYTESGTPVKAALTSPTPGTTLSGSSATFSWTAGGGMTKYEFRVGTTGAGSNDVYNSTDKTTTALTTGAIPVPAYGVTLYARLYSFTYAGALQYTDYTYTESGSPVPATLTGPTPGSTLTGTSATFDWTAGDGIDKYEFRLGQTGPGSKDVYNSADKTTTALTSGAITVPAYGVTLYARIYSFTNNGQSFYNDYTYMESGTPVKAVLTTPTPGSTLTGSSETFDWTAGGGVTKYEFRLGTTGAGSNNVYNATDASTTALTTGAVTVPTTGATLYARLYSYINGAWQYTDYTYTEQ